MAKSIAIETWLNGEGVEWEYHEEVPLTAIDIAKSLENKGRIGKALDDDLVIQYALAMQEGAAFPAIIGHMTSTGYRLITGNHRVAAAREVERETFDLYEVKSNDDYVLERLTRTANSIEGKRDTKEELIEQGKYLVRTYNRPMNEVEAALHLPKDTIGRSLREDQVRARMASIAVDPDKFPRAALVRLNSIATNIALKAFAGLMQEVGLYAGPVFEGMLTELNRLHSEEEQLAKVEEFRKRPDLLERMALTRRGKASGRYTYSPRAQLFRALGSANGLVDRFPSLTVLGVTTTSDAEKLSTEATRLAGKLMRLAREAKARAEANGEARTPLLPNP